MRKLFALAMMCSLAGGASAFVYDNFGSWDGSVTSGWFGQAQKFVVPNVDNNLVSWMSDFDAQMGGLPISFAIMDVVAGIPGGTTYFSTTTNVPGGGGPVSLAMSVPLVSGSTYAAVWGFQGYSGASIHFTGVDVVPGNGMWWSGTSWSDFPGLDQVLRAEFAPVPEPCSLIAITGGLAMLVRRRRK